MLALAETPMVEATVRTVIWHDDRPAVVEDIPAYICSGCAEQFYDDAVSDALHDLVGQGFPVEEAQKEIRVPMFSLNDRIRRFTPNPDGYVIED
jgi:YgiT-type zinc finger domain-containing protein